MVMNSQHLSLTFPIFVSRTEEVQGWNEKTLRNYGERFIVINATWSMLNCRQNGRTRFGRP